MNWNVSNIWDVRDKFVIAHDGSAHLIKLYVEGWRVGDRGSLSIWAACQILNNMEAKPSANKR